MLSSTRSVTLPRPFSKRILLFFLLSLVTPSRASFTRNYDVHKVTPAPRAHTQSRKEMHTQANWHRKYTQTLWRFTDALIRPHHCNARGRSVALGRSHALAFIPMQERHQQKKLTIVSKKRFSCAPDCVPVQKNFQHRLHILFSIRKKAIYILQTHTHTYHGRKASPKGAFADSIATWIVLIEWVQTDQTGLIFADCLFQKLNETGSLCWVSLNSTGLSVKRVGKYPTPALRHNMCKCTVVSGYTHEWVMSREWVMALASKWIGNVTQMNFKILCFTA